jgi:hypothetical protein
MAHDRHAEVFRAAYDTLVEPAPETPDWAELEARVAETSRLTAPFRTPSDRRIWRKPVLAFVIGLFVILIATGGIALWVGGGDPDVADEPIPTTQAPAPTTTTPTPTTTTPTTTLVGTGAPSGLVNDGQATAPERLPAITLTPAPDVDPVLVSTVIGDLEFTTLQFPPGLEFDEGVAWTPFGLVAIDESALWWSTDGVTWEGVPVPVSGGLMVVGDDVVVLGDRSAVWFAWDGTGWIEQTRLELPDQVNHIVFGPRGAVTVTDTMLYYSTDGVHFTKAERPPSKDLLPVEESPSTSLPDDAEFGVCPIIEVIDALLATDAGFVALTAAHPNEWNDDPICEPLLWFSADGNNWELVSHDSPFGGTAFVGGTAGLDEIAERDGRFVAAGGVGGRGAVWVSDDGLTWQQADVDLDYASTVAVGEMGWMLTGGLADRREDPIHPYMWFSTDGLTWDGPYQLPVALASIWGIAPQLAVGSDAIFGVGGPWDRGPVVGRLQD